jgi:diketogulonate reductase-like aldo/keto reductase
MIAFRFRLLNQVPKTSRIIDNSIRHTTFISTMSTIPTSVRLNTGAYIPVINLGTWKSKPGQVEHAVEYALKSAGYKGIDTAVECVMPVTYFAVIGPKRTIRYENEEGIGQGMAASGVPREQIFLTTKLSNDQHHEVEQSLEESLSRLNTPYLDLCMPPSICHFSIYVTSVDRVDALASTNESGL